MKKIILIAIIFFALTSISYSQNLLSSISSTQDTALVNGSTDAGTRWFTASNGAKLFVEVYNGSYWNTYEVNYPCKLISSVRAYVEGTDTTLRVQSDQGGAYIDLPIKVGTNDNARYIDYGSDITVTSKFLIRFREFKQGNL